MEILIPAAGLSTRFPSEKPKYMWKDASGVSMLYKAVRPFLGKYRVTVGILAQHYKFDVDKFMQDNFGNEVCVVPILTLTQGPADTVCQIIKQMNIPYNAELFIKDCDSFFDHSPVEGNYVCVAETNKPEANKSYVSVENEKVFDIAEKKVISNMFCVGGYKFKSVQEFIDGVNLVSDRKTEFFVSNVIKALLSEKKEFRVSTVTNYFDVGTYQDWAKYNNFTEEQADAFYKIYNT